MNVFISWSGEKSNQVAKLLKDWIKDVIQAVDPFVSSEDIEKGSAWDSALTSKLDSTSIGILCLTQENRNKPWILFEAGALSKIYSISRVCPLLVDFPRTDLEPPLSKFTPTVPTESDMLMLVRTVNNSMGDTKLPEEVMLKAFRKFWPDFKVQFDQLISSYHDSTEQTRSEKEVLAEVLDLVRNIDRRSVTKEKEDSKPQLFPLHVKQTKEETRFKIWHGASVRPEDMLTTFQNVVEAVKQVTKEEVYHDYYGPVGGAIWFNTTLGMIERAKVSTAIVSQRWSVTDIIMT